MINEVVSSEMLEICQFLGEKDFMQSFYLAGGTALAMQIKHRKSLDIVFFLEKK